MRGLLFGRALDRLGGLGGATCILGFAVAALVADLATLVDRVGDHAAHQGSGTDGVVVARNHVADDVRVAVGIDHRNDRQAQLVGLGHRDVFLLGVQDEHRVRQRLQVADAIQVTLQLGQLAGEQQRFLLRHGLKLTGVAHALVLLHL